MQNPINWGGGAYKIWDSLFEKMVQFPDGYGLGVCLVLDCEGGQWEMVCILLVFLKRCDLIFEMFSGKKQTQILRSQKLLHSVFRRHV